MIEAGLLWLVLALAAVLVIGLIVVTVLLFGLTALWFRRLDRIDGAIGYVERRMVQLADTADNAREGVTNDRQRRGRPH